MLTLRPDQMAAFQQVALSQFEEAMVAHLHQFAPRHCDVIGEGNVRRVVRLGIDRAAAYSMTYRGPVRLYLELMVLFGSGFDTDPQLRWATHILGSGDGVDQMDRAGALRSGAVDYLDRVSGPESVYTRRALVAIRAQVGGPFTLSQQFAENDMLAAMRRTYPQKASFVGEPALRVLIQNAVSSARKHRIQSVRGTVLFVVLMFALGHACADDPLFPWLSKTLNDPRISDPEDRAERLERKAVHYLDHVLAYLGDR